MVTEDTLARKQKNKTCRTNDN